MLAQAQESVYIKADKGILNAFILSFFSAFSQFLSLFIFNFYLCNLSFIFLFFFHFVSDVIEQLTFSFIP